MTQDADLLRRIDRIESRFAIAALCTAYARACDDREIDKLGDMFAEDAMFRSYDGSRDTKGRDTIVNMYRGRFAALGPTYHWTHDIDITFDDATPNIASSKMMGHAECWRSGAAYVAAMRYEDIFTRAADGKWRIQDRMISYFYYMKVEEYATGLGQKDRTRSGPEPKLADWPEKLPSWIAYHAPKAAE